MESRLARKNNEFSIDKLSQALDLTSDEETTKEEHKILQVGHTLCVIKKEVDKIFDL